MALAVKNLSANAGDARDVGSIPEVGRSLEEEMEATCSSILAWEITWTQEPGGLQSTGSQRVRHDSAHTHTQLFYSVVLVSAVYDPSLLSLLPTHPTPPPSYPSK